ncbi:uncharacterized protein LOC133520201 [Cydia pomonella]|uniref:uncharacterized protein LOC133520201 n=1 Tax=Cydia pomonella TaxID=82600 RepID=UPI002ADE0523|nr:uncharacterized protein LOC133520201 [Cydia pomonella]
MIYPMPNGGVYRFENNETVTLNCVLNCTACPVDTKYTLHFYLHENEDNMKRVVVKTGAPATVTKTFTLHENDTEIVCKKLGHFSIEDLKTHSTVKLQMIRKDKGTGQAFGLSYFAWLAIIISILLVALILAAIFACIVFKSRRKGKECENEGKTNQPPKPSENLYHMNESKATHTMKNRPLPPRPSDAIYERKYII